jgi:hypothetical protein
MGPKAAAIAALAWFWFSYAAPLTFAHRGFCARLILRRPAADMVRDEPLELAVKGHSGLALGFWGVCAYWVQRPKPPTTSP